MCGSFGMISVVVHFILWLIIMWLVNHFMGVQMHFSIAFVPPKKAIMRWNFGRISVVAFTPPKKANWKVSIRWFSLGE